MIYLYARVSTDKQENGREAQLARLEQGAKSKGLSVDGVFVDEDVSALYVDLPARPEGKKLWDTLAGGDTVIITKVDRAFRSWADAGVTIKRWQKENVTLEILDMPIDLNTPPGRLFFSQIVSFAQFESEMHGQRKREVYANKKKLGQPYNQFRPLGWLAVKGKSGRLESWQPCIAEQELGRRVLRMRCQGMSFPAIALVLCREDVRKPVRKKGSSGYYHQNDVYYLARAAKAGYPKLPRGSLPALAT